MVKNENLSIAETFAPDYDDVIISNGWCSPEVIFQMSSEFVDSGQKILDIGIGTGLGSLEFQKMGCEIVGIDGSKKMLEICESKNIATDLRQYDLTCNNPLPFQDLFFNHAISIGVFHLVGDLSYLYREISRIIRKNGIFGFTTDSTDKVENQFAEEKNKKTGVTTFKHDENYIASMLKQNGFTILKQTKFLAYEATSWSDKIYFNAYIAQKTK